MYRLDTSGNLVLNEAVRLILDKVQRRGNDDVEYREDIQSYKLVEKWAYPKLVNNKLVGDCEDIALYKRKLLIDAGVPESVLLLTICLDPSSSGHCVLCVVTNKRDYVLCNAHKSVSTPIEMKAEGYKFLYRQKLGQGIDKPWDVLK